MRYLRLKLTNYIGIYNGMNMNEIEIDFTKCKNKIIMIKGDNASGKSTIYGALHVFPDPNECFIPGLPAEKQIDLQHEDLLYFIRISHNVNTKGERETTKVYIKKGNIYDNVVEDLNPNGNVRSFIEIIYSELLLDPNFLALTSLSGNNRGLADMKPADRKKYVNAIIKDLVYYNDIYKVLVKRSSTFKSMINNLSNKINNLGNEETLKSMLISIDNRLNKLMDDKDKLIESISENKSMVKVLDPNGENLKIYDTLYNELNNLMNTRDSLVNKRIKLLKQINLSNDNNIPDTFKTIKDNYIEVTTDIQVHENKIQSILSDKEKKCKEIEELNVKLYSYTSDRNFDDIVENINLLNSELSMYESELSKRNTNNLLSLDEYDIILKLLDDINLSLYNIKDTYNMSIYNDDNNINYNDTERLQLEDELNSIKEKIIYYNSLSNVLDKLNLRPNNCTIDSCAFIQDAINALDEKPKDKLIELSNRQLYIEDRLKQLYTIMEYSSEYNRFINEFNIIIRTVNNYSNLLNKSNICLSGETIMDALRGNYSFSNEIMIINQYKDTVNILTMYNKTKEQLNILNNDYQTYLNKKELIDYITKSLAQLQDDLMDIIKTLDDTNDILLELKTKQIMSKQILDVLEDIIKCDSELFTIENTINDINSKLYTIQTNINNIKSYISSIEKQNKDLEYINNQISPLIKDRDTLNYNIRLLDEYMNELVVFKDKYNKIEVIKKHCSPTKGIQLIFIELYMNSTLSLANEMLSMLFDGEYMLKPFIINESEFKIPCVGSGLGNDDISSMSTSQICMISMILSFSLLQQSSTKFNILKLDEIDGGLDTNNRRIFVSLMDRLMDILNVEQTIMISHNNEIALDNVDLVLLKLNDSTDLSMYNKNNVIYRFSA